MCRGYALQLEEKTSFVERWMDILWLGYEAIKDHSFKEEKAQNLEKQVMLTSLTNLMTFPFLEKAVQDGSLSLHSLWTNIGEGSLKAFDWRCKGLSLSELFRITLNKIRDSARCCKK